MQMSMKWAIYEAEYTLNPAKILYPRMKGWSIVPLFPRFIMWSGLFLPFRDPDYDLLMAALPPLPHR